MALRDSRRNSRGPLGVIPAKAGIQALGKTPLDCRLRGNDTGDAYLGTVFPGITQGQLVTGSVGVDPQSLADAVHACGDRNHGRAAVERLLDGRRVVLLPRMRLR